jgi:hypothetical protein
VDTPVIGALGAVALDGPLEVSDCLVASSREGAFSLSASVEGADGVAVSLDALAGGCTAALCRTAGAPGDPKGQDTFTIPLRTSANPAITSTSTMPNTRGRREFLVRFASSISSKSPRTVGSSSATHRLAGLGAAGFSACAGATGSGIGIGSGTVAFGSGPATAGSGAATLRS